jgi:hypothetical protein
MHPHEDVLQLRLPPDKCACVHDAATRLARSVSRRPWQTRLMSDRGSQTDHHGLCRAHELPPRTSPGERGMNQTPTPETARCLYTSSHHSFLMASEMTL